MSQPFYYGDMVPDSRLYDLARKAVPPLEFTDPSHPSEEIERFLFLLINTTFRMRDSRKTPAQVREMVAQFESHWLNIWSWTSAMVKHWSQLDNEPTTEEGKNFQARLFVVFEKVLCMPSTGGNPSRPHSSILSFMRKRADVYSTILRVCTYTLERSHHCHRLMLYLLGLALEIPEMHRDTDLATCNVAILVRSPHIISILFSFITIQLCKDPSDESYAAMELGYALRIVSFLARRRSETLSVLIHSYDLLRHACLWCRLLVAPNSINELGIDIKTDVKLMEQCTDFLKYALTPLELAVKDHGVPAMALILRGGVLQSMINAGSLIGFEDALGPQGQPKSPGVCTLSQTFVAIVGRLTTVPSMLCSARVSKLSSKAIERIIDPEDERRVEKHLWFS